MNAAAQPAAHPLDTAVALDPVGPGRWRGRVSADYWNMVGPYGGITAAVMLKAMLDHPQREGWPLSFTLNYLAPVAAGDYLIDAELVHANRSNQHWAIRLRQGTPERTLAQAIAICAVRRAVWSEVEARPPTVPPAEQCAVVPPPETGGFLQRYEFRIVRGQPFRDNGDSVSHAWVADAPPRPLDIVSLTALCDSFMPRIFLRRERFTPIGTVSLNIYFHAGPDVLARQGSAPLLAVAEAQAYSDGHFDHHGHLWGRDNALLATSHQLVWYKE